MSGHVVADAMLTNEELTGRIGEVAGRLTTQFNIQHIALQPERAGQCTNALTTL